jgi:hypothetical protein
VQNQGVATIQGWSVGRISKESDSLSVAATRMEFTAGITGVKAANIRNGGHARMTLLSGAPSARGGVFESDGEGGDGVSCDG